MDEYKCTNIAFAVYLEQNNFKVERIEIDRPGKGVFYFKISTDELDMIRRNWNNSPEASFNDRLNRMKSLTY
jgi:hypothetical protein